MHMTDISHKSKIKEAGKFWSGKPGTSGFQIRNFRIFQAELAKNNKTLFHHLLSH